MFGGGFEQFFGGGRGFGAGEETFPGEVDNVKFYELLGVDKNASESEIRSAYRKLAKVHHPDRGGDTETFQQLQRAYEVLSDPHKKEVYDKYGEKGLSGDAEHPGAGGMDDILRSFFGGGSGRGGPRGPTRGKDVGVRFSVTLEDLYCGAEKELEWERKTICDGCDGLGGPADAKKECSTCDGHGMIIRLIRMGPIAQQERRACPDCKGQGFSFNESKKCKKCKGNGLKVEHKVLKFSVNPGMDNKDKIKLMEEGDKLSKDMIPGDLYIILEVEDHPMFERKGDHLIFKKTINLLESITGFQFTITHLDGRPLRLISRLGKVYKPGELQVVSGEGMPSHRNPNLKGNLIVQFDVEFPNTLNIDASSYATLRALLPCGANTHPNFMTEDEKVKIASSKSSVKKSKKRAKKGQSTAEVADEIDSTPIDVMMEDISEDAFGRMKHERQGRGQHDHNDDDDEDESGGTQCRVQ